ncbi:hypothetical protein GW782_00570, partial [bacterium]|nr:hypothetical protein [archaeon]
MVKTTNLSLNNRNVEELQDIILDNEISDEKISNIFKESAKNLNFSFSDDDLTDL